VASALRASAESPLNVYGFWDAEEGILGATPELLFRRKGPRSIETAAVAGTRPHAALSGDRLPLMDDPKEVEEHQFVIDGIREAFRDMGTVVVGATRELRLSRFSHLFAPVEVCFDRNERFEAIVRALHPTPAVGGWPRQAGMQWLEWMEREDEAAGVGERNRFGAPFGAITATGEGICWVAIRGMQWVHHAVDATLSIAAGCGVTGRSELQREWHELGIKLQAIRTALAV
jgi:menaquinone-specific isochorismate synthase